MFLVPRKLIRHPRAQHWTYLMTRTGAGSLASSFHGMDEAMSFTEVMKMFQTMDYSCVVYDTAPNGEELKTRFLYKGL